MKIILDIKDNNKTSFFLDLIKGLDYVHVVKEFKDKGKSKVVGEL